MGLLDILNSVPAGGVSNDPRARAAPPSQGMSPTAKALLALLAIYAMKNLRRADAPPTQPGRPAGGNVSAGVPGGQGGTLGGGLGDLLRGIVASIPKRLMRQRLASVMRVRHVVRGWGRPGG